MNRRPLPGGPHPFDQRRTADFRKLLRVAAQNHHRELSKGVREQDAIMAVAGEGFAALLRIAVYAVYDRLRQLVVCFFIARHLSSIG